MARAGLVNVKPLTKPRETVDILLGEMEMMNKLSDLIQKPWAEAKLTILEVDNRHQKEYILQLILERDALRAEVQRLRQAMKETVRHE